MKNLTCSKCGGLINPNTYQCEYCGTYYEKPRYETEPLRILQIPTSVVPLQAECMADRNFAEMVGDEIGKFTYNQLANKLAEELVKYMDIKITEDYCTNSLITRGRVRVVLPDYRFTGRRTE